MDKRIVLITGASGYIGRALTQRLGGTYRVIGLDRSSVEDNPDLEASYAIDLADEASVVDALAKVRAAHGKTIAACIHLAAYFDITGEPNPLYNDVNVEGSRRLIKALQDFDVEQFVYASSMLVHEPKPLPDERIDEFTPIGPTWPYPQSKADAEQVLRKNRGDIPVVFLRFAGVYDDEGHSAFLAEQIAGVYEHRMSAHLYPGMLCAAQSALHLEDLTKAVEQTIAHRANLEGETPILIGESETLGYAEIQDIVHCQIHGEEWTTVRIPKSVAKLGTWIEEEVLGHDGFVKQWMVDDANAHYVLDISRARKLLGWEPEHSLRETLPTIIDALKADPQDWYETNKLNTSRVAWHPKRSDPKETEPATTSSHDADMSHDNDKSRNGHQMAGEMHDMDGPQRGTRWTHFAVIGLGLWLAASPGVYDVVSAETARASVVAVSIERGLPSIEWRANALALSDMLSGIALMIFGAMSLSKRTAWLGQWATAFIGIWLLFAPLFFWSPSAAQYLTNLLVGTLVIAFAVLVPMMPGMSMEGMMDKKSIPPGWTYSPSTDAQRFPIVAMGIIGLLISRMLTSYQLGHIDVAWEPFFSGSLADPKNGTEEIITSDVSKAWPIPDAGLGAVSYVLEILMAVMGTRARWRTMPWMVTFFGILVIPLGVISIYFVIIQPIVIGTWSTPALIAALAMLIMIPFSLDEVIAMGQYLYWSKKEGKPLVRTFFKGGAASRGEIDDTDYMTDAGSIWANTVRGVTFPWTLIASTALGAWLMLSRITLGNEGAMANSDHVVGALVITVAIIATAEVARALRFINVAFGAWLVAAPFILAGASSAGTVASVGVGLLLIGLSLPRGKRSGEHYAGWDRFVV
ncbi:NAD-dependent epimerase/dehydratase family protein [Novosphingopyxis baekryungensis]|uniref:NAD-dependent epimerase/dehydratase family protein n=1 Tax=Novosphingopyxis baekryungensis TaxID=279369 RepID=UPI0003B46EC1|nr:NAD-dependent epimerase/dehydratase family protein [Novosphingopyxis baekryungensis]